MHAQLRAEERERGTDVSRTLDDIEELIPPLAFALGALYFIYWATQTLEHDIIEPIADIPATVYEDFKEVAGETEDWLGDRVDWLWDRAGDAYDLSVQINPVWGWFR